MGLTPSIAYVLVGQEARDLSADVRILLFMVTPLGVLKTAAEGLVKRGVVGAKSDRDPEPTVARRQPGSSGALSPLVTLVQMENALLVLANPCNGRRD
jgi:hypothetical protein